MTRKRGQAGAAYRGKRAEQRVVRELGEAGITAHRIPASGSMPGYPGDILIRDALRAEVKSRLNACSFARVRDWLGEMDVLFLEDAPERGTPSKELLVVMPMARFLALLDATQPRQAPEAVGAQEEE